MAHSLMLRVADFLRKYPPFNLLRDKDLLMVAKSVNIVYKADEELIFEQGEKVGEYIYVLREGAVYLKRKEQQGYSLIDTCDEGDLFGVRPLLAEEVYGLRAEAAENSLLYGVDVKVITQLMEQQPKLALYFAKSFAAGLHQSYDTFYRNAAHHTESEGQVLEEDNLQEVQLLQTKKAPVYCKNDLPVQDAAQIMCEKQVSSIIIVNDELFPVGIVTDKDLRMQIATGKFPANIPISRIMSSPVVTALPEISLAAIQMSMIKNGIHHLVLTEDGTDQSLIQGVITEHDIMVTQANNPAVLIRKIKHSSKVAALRKVRERAELLLEKYLIQEVSIKFISEVMSSINDAIIQKCIFLSLEELKDQGQGEPPVGFCWLALGSEGREEQLLRTDQDNALVFEDADQERNDKHQAFFLKLAKLVTEKLNECGFDYCPADMMASNPKWCLSLSQWKSQFSKWLLEPSSEAILLSSIFFDFRPIYGNFDLSDSLREHIFSNIDQRTPFLNFLAKDALQNPPPLSFFRNFVVEKSGEHADAFDIKARAMMPLTDAARVLILSSKVGGVNNTFRRFDKLAELEPQNKALYEQASDAYEILMRYRAYYGLQQGDSGRYISPEALSKMERLNLRNSFRPIRELQSLLSTRFSLSYIM